MLDLGTVEVGAVAVASLSVENQGRYELPVLIKVALPLRVSTPSLSVPAGGHIQVEVYWGAKESGGFESELILETEGQRTQVPVRGTAIVSDVCKRLGDGAPCESPCLTSGLCDEGVCKGSPRSCDDGNPCTRDACVSGAGCIHTEAVDACPVSDDPCQVPVCDPLTGCGSVTLADGVACGPSDCVRAYVCVAGSCVERSVPDGSVCGEGSPCQQPGTCRGGECDRPPPDTIRWEWFSSGIGAFTTLLADDEGNAYFVQDAVESISPNGKGRWLYEGPRPTSAMISSGLLVLSTADSMSGLNLGDGTVIWSLDASELKAVMDAGLSVLNVDWVAEAEAGALWAGVSGWYTHDGQPHQWLLRLETKNGAVLSSKQLSAVTTNPALDESGRLFVSVMAGGGENVAELNSHTGTVLWMSSAQDAGRILGAYKGSAITSGRETRSWAKGSASWSAQVAAIWGKGDDAITNLAAVTDGRTLWMRGTSPDSQGPALYGIDFQTGRVLWSRALRFAAQPILTQRGTVLVIEQQDDDGDETTLREFDRFGNETMQCPLMVWNRMVTEPILTSTGHLVHAVSPHGFVSYWIGRTEAEQGWASGRGNSQRTRRAR